MGDEAVLDAIKPFLPMVRSMPGIDFAELPARRAAAREAAASGRSGVIPGPPDVTDVTTTARMIPVDGGEIELRIHTPDGVTTAAPCFVWFHGGGWVIGSALEDEMRSRRFASRLGWVVVAVDYRLAPESKFPIPVEDCYAATEWVAANAAALGVDPTRIAIGGGSAGGNIAAAVALMLRDRGGPAVIAQVLDVPATDLTLPDDTSMREYGEGYFLGRPEIQQCVDSYARDDVDPKNPYMSPALASDLSNLPPALVSTCGCDPLRDQGERYASALRAAGNEATYNDWPGHLHGTMGMIGLDPSCQSYEDSVIAFLRSKA